MMMRKTIANRWLLGVALCGVMMPGTTLKADADNRVKPGETKEGEGKGDVRELGEKEIETLRRPSLSFQAVTDMRDPRTGRPVGPNDVITVDKPDGTSVAMKAADYYAMINKVGAGFASLGIDPGAPDSDTRVGRARIDKAGMDERRAEEARKMQPKDPFLVDPVPSVEDVKSRLERAIADAGETARLSLYRRAAERAASLPGAGAFAPVSPEVVKKAEPKLANILHKGWAYELGKKETIGVSASANVEMNGSLTAAEVKANARADAYIFAREFNIVSAEAWAKMTRDPSERYQGTSRFALAFLNETIFEIPKTPKTPKDAEDPAAATSDKGQALSSGDVMGLKDLPFSKSIRREYPYHFLVGPIPVSGAIGAAGTAGLDWALGHAELSATGQLVPQIKVSVYTKLGVDLAIASVGVQGNVVLMEQLLTLQGSAAVEKDPVTQAPRVAVTARGIHTLTSLTGELEAYVEYLDPKSIPSGKKARASTQLFAYDGMAIKKEKVLFDFGKVATQEGYFLRGMPTREDYEDAAVEKELASAMQSVIDGMNDPAQAKIRATANTASSYWQVAREDWQTWVASWATP